MKSKVGLLVLNQLQRPFMYRLPRDKQPFQQLIACVAMLFWGSSTAYTIEPIPAPSYGFLETYCLDCHDDFERKAEISLEEPEIDWSNHESVELWERVIKVLNTVEMPPRKERQPSASERTAMTEWLDDRLLEHSPIGGTALRRLNKREYRSSLNQLFEIDYKLPDGFPEDNRAHGFDNQGDALTLSGPLLDSYLKVANDLAEKLFPLNKNLLKQARSKFGGKTSPIPTLLGRWLMASCVRFPVPTRLPW